MMGIELLVLIPFSLKFKWLRREQLAIFAYIICSIVYGSGSYIQGMIYKQNNMLFNSCMTFIQSIILSTFFYLSLKNKRLKQLFLVLCAAGVFIFAMDITVWEGPRASNSIFGTYRSITFILYGILLFLQLLKDEELIEKSIFVNQVPLFWFNSGLFIFTTCFFLHSMTANALQHLYTKGELTDTHRAIQQVSRTINFAAGIIQFFLLYIGLTKIKRARQ